ncbi:endonuclease SmrB [Idiomarina tyrosinivorans]|uniref:Endonuclease SmrB n=1 Tax=Idiomarina tyrosinivorans TaxID=1445662 RepID=A0A432ZRH9_9GAMM|nr:endonuclease SmrB [Idiomarina tyrosinivorans]RUO80510.1 endonuclease SmrB [Idiomarina tyrosinivorans]
MRDKSFPDSAPEQTFAELFDDVQPLTQDKVVFDKQPLSKRRAEDDKQQRQINSADNLLSDNFEAHFPDEKPTYLAEGSDSHLLKRLSRGDFAPELLLDVHGFTQAQAKPEVLALLHACVNERIRCCSILHGHGKGVLKRQIPNWLVQHPQVEAFHTAPRALGGDAALLILVRVGD